MDREEMLSRMRAFGVRIIKLNAALPKDAAGRTLASQVLRAGTSIGANYHEACHASSKRHFITTMEIAQREARETLYWLELLAEADIISSKRLKPLREECDELIAILTATIRTAKSRN
jgi:four helix bundle protein